MIRGSEARVRAAVVAMFFVSGISGLVYQIVWVRQFARIFGNTVHSASLVAGVFMGGLGLGSYVIGRLADRRFRADPSHPLRVYGLSEIAIGALGLLFAIVLPRMASISASMSSYERGAGGFFELSFAAHAVRYVVAILAVAPASFLMGGTLTLLIRFVVAHDLEAVGARIGVLYGVNTAGAALGALLTDFFLVPWLGLFSTQFVAITLNVAAGAAAVALAKRTAGPAPTEAPQSACQNRPEPGEGQGERPASGRLPAPSPAEDGSVRRGEKDEGPAAGEAADGAVRLAALTSASLFLAGFAAMGLEIAWFRLLTEILGALRIVFSLLLAVLLTGIWIGAILGGYLHRRFGRPAALFIGGQTLFTVVTVVLLGFVDHSAIAVRHFGALTPSYLAAPPGERTLLELWSNLRSIGLLVLPPSILMGATFPLANAVAQRAEAKVAGRAGVLYLANTAGNVLGSAVVGFAMLPALGLQRSSFVLLICAAASVVPIALAARAPRPAGQGAQPIEIAFIGAVGALIAAISSFAQIPEDFLLRVSLPYVGERASHRILSMSEGLNETIVIAQIPGYMTRLYTNGHSMATDGPKSQRYMRSFSHLPLLSMDRPERVLVICFGTGNTLHAASLHPSVERIEIADLSRHVLEQAPFFRETNRDILKDPRVSVFINDGRHHLLMAQPSTYDMITLEPPPIALAGVGALYSRELYELSRSRLKPGGYLSQWLPGYQLGGDAVRSMVRAFIEVFPASVMVSGDDNELILLGVNGDGITLDLEAVARRLRERPRVREDMERIEMGSLTEIAGTFAASVETMRAASRNVPVLTDDRPSIEYARRARLSSRGVSWMPRDLFDTSGVGAWCPRCLATLPDLAGYLRVRQRIYESDWFLSRRPESALPMDAEIASVMAKSEYLRRLYGGEAYSARKVGLEHLARGDVELAIGALRHAALSSAGDAGIYADLGEAYLLAGDYQVAADVLVRSLKLDDSRAATHFAFAQVLSRLGQGAPAMREYEMGIKLDPDDGSAHYAFATLLNGMGKKDEAEAEMTTALELDPYEPRANLVLCKRAAARGDLAAAAGHCDIAATLGVAVPADLLAKIAARPR